MNKNYKPSSLDYTNAITDAHSEDNKALSVVTANNLVPVRFGKVELTYITSGNGAGSVGQARYYSNGAYQETRIVCRGDSLGSAHKTAISFINKTSASLDGRCFVVYDSIGAVKVWYNVDFNSTEPVISNTYRSIAVNILSSHTHETIANRTALALSADSEFIAVYNSYYVVISSSSIGVKENSYDISTGMFIKNTSGVEAKSLNGAYFYINSATNTNQYYVWYNVAGTGNDPNIPGKVGLMVEITTGSTAEIVCQSTKTVLDNTNKFITNINGDAMIITNVTIGQTNIASDINTDFLIFQQKLGENRELLAILNMEYDSQNNIISVERV
jgi:hypothetical protein